MKNASRIRIESTKDGRIHPRESVECFVRCVLRTRATGRATGSSASRTKVRDPFGQTLFLGAHVVWVRKCHLQSCTLRRSANVSNEVSALDDTDTDDDSENVAVPEERSETNARTRV